MSETFPNPISKSNFARQCGVSPAAITKAMSPGGLLDGCHYGKQIDSNNPQALEYLENKLNPRRRKKKPVAKRKPVAKKKASPKAKAKPKQKEPKKDEKKPAKRKAAPRKGVEKKPTTVATEQRVKRGAEARRERMKMAPPPKPIDMLPHDIRELVDWPFRELIEKFATDNRFKEWTEGAKSLEVIAEKRIKNAKSLGDLVSKAMVKSCFISPVQEFHAKLLMDGAKSIASEVHAMAKTGKNVTQCERIVRKQIERFLKPMKTRLRKNLKNV